MFVVIFISLLLSECSILIFSVYLFVYKFRYTIQSWEESKFLHSTSVKPFYGIFQNESERADPSIPDLTLENRIKEYFSLENNDGGVAPFGWDLICYDVGDISGQLKYRSMFSKEVLLKFIIFNIVNLFLKQTYILVFAILSNSFFILLIYYLYIYAYLTFYQHQLFFFFWFIISVIFKTTVILYSIPGRLNSEFITRYCKSRPNIAKAFYSPIQGWGVGLNKRLKWFNYCWSLSRGNYDLSPMDLPPLLLLERENFCHWYVSYLTLCTSEEKEIMRYDWDEYEVISSIHGTDLPNIANYREQQNNKLFTCPWGNRYRFIIKREYTRSSLFFINYTLLPLLQNLD